jgi:phosphate transport system protein
VLDRGHRTRSIARPQGTAVTTHYEERLQKDLAWIQDLVSIVGAQVDEAIGNSVKAVLTLDRDLAADTVIGDYLVNRQTRELDRLCHAFVARHLPSAGHLRFVSSVMRLTIALERIGDYGATISRTAAQLSTHAPPVVQRDIEMMCEHARRMLHEGLRSFQNRDVALANATLTAAAHFADHFDKVFDDLVTEGEARTRPVNDLFALMATFNRLERVIHQAKNICEETIFVGTGKAKGEKTFQILFVDEKNDGPSQLAEHFTKKAFPQSGTYRSAGWQPAEEIDRGYTAFALQHGIDLSRAWPAPLSTLHDQLDDFHFVIGLHPDARSKVGRVPFHTTLLVWDLEGAVTPDEVYRRLAPMVRSLMEKLRGEQAC